MSAYHSRIVEEFRQHGGTLTGPQLAAAVGRLWPKDIHEMRKARYLIVEDAAGLWHLDLEALPELDAGRAGGTTEAEDRTHVHVGSASCVHGDAKAASSPGIDPDPQVEGETPVLFEAPVKAASPYDVEAA